MIRLEVDRGWEKGQIGLYMLLTLPFGMYILNFD